MSEEVTTNEEVTEEEFKADWKAAAKKLKAVTEDYAVDNYFKRVKALALKERYNNKERSEELYNSITGL